MLEVDVLAITAEDRLLLGVVIDQASDNWSPGLFRSEVFEAIQTEHWTKMTVFDQKPS